jgi:hypothetical protein
MAMHACDALAADDDDLLSLATACRSLSTLAAYGSSRKLAGGGDQAIAALCVKTFDRAVLRVGDACGGDDEAVAPALTSMRLLHDVALAQPLVDRASWMAAAGEVARSYAVNPLAAGLAAGLLYLAQELDDAQVATLVEQRLTATFEPLAGAAFLEGFLRVNALVLARSREVVRTLDAFLASIPAERFTTVLPLLRRAFATVGATERRYLLENVLAVRGLGAHADDARAVLAERDTARLGEMASELDEAMDDLDDLL